MTKKKYVLVGMLVIFSCFQIPPAKAQDVNKEKILAQQIKADPALKQVKSMATDLIKSGFNAGTGYSEVWIRDFNTFIEVSCKVMPADTVKDRLRKFFQFQGKDGNIVDGYSRRVDQTVNYDFLYSKDLPNLVGHKNTVETDQESSLVQAIFKYVKATGDKAFLAEIIDGKSVRERLQDAMQYLMNERYNKQYGLIYGATTADWGDVQPEADWGVKMDDSSHLAIDIYDNAMFLIAINNYLQLFPKDRTWGKVASSIKKNVRKYLWDDKNQKFIPHIYLHGSPFPASFDENKINYHGGTATAIEAGLLTHPEIATVNNQMLQDVAASGAMSIGLTLYPVYPEGFFKNKGMYPYGYQNGGDWTWFGARMIMQLVRNGYVKEAYNEIKPMLDRVLANKGFYEWYTIDGKAAGSADFRGSAGVLYDAISDLQGWAKKH